MSCRACPSTGWPHLRTTRCCRYRLSSSLSCPSREALSTQTTRSNQRDLTIEPPGEMFFWFVLMIFVSFKISRRISLKWYSAVTYIFLLWIFQRPPILHATSVWLTYGRGFENVESEAKDESESDSGSNFGQGPTNASAAAKTSDDINTERFHLVISVN